MLIDGIGREFRIALGAAGVPGLLEGTSALGDAGDRAIGRRHEVRRAGQRLPVLSRAKCPAPRRVLQDRDVVASGIDHGKRSYAISLRSAKSYTQLNLRNPPALQ